MVRQLSHTAFLCQASQTTGGEEQADLASGLTKLLAAARRPRTHTHPPGWRGRIRYTSRLRAVEEYKKISGHFLTGHGPARGSGEEVFKNVAG